jgi:hypothetical protein
MHYWTESNDIYHFINTLQKDLKKLKLSLRTCFKFCYIYFKINQNIPFHTFRSCEGCD